MKRAAFVVTAFLISATATAASIPDAGKAQNPNKTEMRLEEFPEVLPDGTIDLTRVVLGFYRGGKAVMEYRLQELVVKIREIPVDEGRVNWIATSETEGDILRLTTIDGQIYHFNIPTGEIRYIKKKYN